MFRTTVRLSDQTDPDLALEDLHRKARKAGLDHPTLALLMEQARQTIEPLVHHREELRAVNGHMKATREISTASFSVKIVSSFGPRKSPIAHLLGALRGR